MTPNSETDLAEAIASAKSPFSIQGGGTRSPDLSGKFTPLSTSGLSGIELYEPGALTIVAKAGTPLADIDAALASEGQRLAFEPMDHRGLLGTTGTPTIGGAVAANVSGPRRVQAGACRDYLLGVRFVNGSGQIVKNGGRVMKNVTGYDLVKLMAGSYGTLGVLSEVAFKVLPIPETSTTLTAHDLTNEDAQKLMSQSLSSPYEVTAVAHIPAQDSTDARTLLRIEGFENSVKYRSEKLQSLLSQFGEISVKSDAQNWQNIRDVKPFHGKSGNVWRISVKPTDGSMIAAKLTTDGILFDWAGGLVWALMPTEIDARAQLGDFNGHATLIRRDAGDFPTFQPEPKPLAALTRGIRQKFDPKGILNPGLMGP